MAAPKNITQSRQELMAWIWQEKFRTDPYLAIMACFPWGVKGTPLEKFNGPRKWQVEELQKIAMHIKRTGIEDAFQRYDLSISSGRGSGKSAFIGMITWFFRTMVLGGTCTVTANTEIQLCKKTFPEIKKWNSLAINSDWWEYTVLSITPASWFAAALLKDKGIDSSLYYTQGVTWNPDNPDAFAGNHSHYGMMMIFDESSGIADTIFSVTDGIFTEPIQYRFWLIFGNMRRNSGKFYETQYGFERKFWNHRRIDCRQVEGLDQSVFTNLIEKSGSADSDEARVEVYGLPPKGKSDSIIPRTFSEAAAVREVELEAYAPIIWGLDPAVDGDRRVLTERQGNMLVWWKKYESMEPMALCNAIKNDYDQATSKPLAILVEGCGVGSIYYSRLKQLKLPVFKVNISDRDICGVAYFNLRTELIYKVRDWLCLGNTRIPNEEEVIRDFSIPRVDYQSSDHYSTGLLIAESKKSIRARGEVSYDILESFMMTFAKEHLVESENQRMGRTGTKMKKRVTRCA